MKILFSFIILTVLLFGRANPFEATTTYNEKKQMLLMEQEKLEQEERERKLEESRKNLDMMALKQQEIIEENEQLAQDDESVLVEESVSKVEKEEKDSALGVQEVKSEPKPTIKIVEKIIEKPVIKEKIKIVKIENFDLLPFVNIKLSDENIEVMVNKKYKFINQMILHEKGKFIFDFKGKLHFYTKRKSFNNPNFESVTIGNHPEKNFFRVVIKVKNNIKSYKEKIKSDKNTFTIDKI